MPPVSPETGGIIGSEGVEENAGAAGIAGIMALTLLVARAARETTRERALLTRALALRLTLLTVLRALAFTRLIEARARPATLRALDLAPRAADLARDFRLLSRLRFFALDLERAFFFAMETVSQKTVV